MINGAFSFQWYLWQHKAVVRLVRPNSSWISIYVIACDGPPLTSTSPHQSSSAACSSGKLVYQRSYPSTPPPYCCQHHHHLPPSPFNQAWGYNASLALTSDQRRGHGGKVGARAEPIHYSSCFSRWQPDDGILLRAPSIQHRDYTRALSPGHTSPPAPEPSPKTLFLPWGLYSPSTFDGACPLQLVQLTSTFAQPEWQ